MPTIVNLRQDPFERVSDLRGESTNDGAFGYGNDFYAREFWRFVLVQKEVGRLAQTALGILRCRIRLALTCRP